MIELLTQPPIVCGLFFVLLGVACGLFLILSALATKLSRLADDSTHIGYACVTRAGLIDSVRSKEETEKAIEKSNQENPDEPRLLVEVRWPK